MSQPASGNAPVLAIQLYADVDCDQERFPLPTLNAMLTVW